ncbi:MAG: SH3 domain-containing C40 family peptidase [Elusimicrobia bacterium]|nr:SH3 domain-containing C40 family peptidase [Elusimicrobiota bacterium]
MKRLSASPILLAAAVSLGFAASAWAVGEFQVPAVHASLGNGDSRSDGYADADMRDSLSSKDIERTLYVNGDGVDVMQAPVSDPTDESRLTQLQRGETVKVLGDRDVDHVHWYYVEVPRREYDETSAGWKNTRGWMRDSYSDPLSGQTMKSFSTDPKIALPAPKEMAAGGCRSAFVEAMKTFLGVPYKWGGTSHSGVDCSGLVQSSMIQAGCVKEPPPRTAADQQRASTPIGSKDELRDGDLVFLSNGGGVHHVIGFIGQGQVIEAPHSGDVVKISELEQRLKGTNDRILFGSLLGN